MASRVIEVSLDPRDYDMEELRGSSEGFVDRDQPVDSPPTDDPLQASHYRKLLLLQNRGARVGLEKPYLTSLPATYEGELVTFEWLDYLVTKGGFKRTYDALRHYRAVGWLTGAAEAELREYLAGIPETTHRGTEPLAQSDHLLSLIYIGRLATE